MAKYVCSVCGYVHEDVTAPENCPVCMASASEFSEIEEAYLIETEPALDKVEDVIEKEEEKTDESLDESNQERIAPDEFIKPTSNMNVQNTERGPVVDKNENVETDVEADEVEIVNLYKETQSALQVVKWYKETYNVGLKEAKDRVDFVLDKHELRSLTKGNGCMITILIAITSTLSAFFLL